MEKLQIKSKLISLEKQLEVLERERKANQQPEGFV